MAPLMITINRPRRGMRSDLEVAERIESALWNWIRRTIWSSASSPEPEVPSAQEWTSKRSYKESARRHPSGGFAGLVENPPHKPLIAAVEGYALAGGFEITLACDLVVASSSAVFGLPEMKRGWSPPPGAAPITAADPRPRGAGVRLDR